MLAQYVDLDATLRNYRAEEAQYLDIMRRAATVKDTLEVAEKLADVRGRMERQQAQMNLLSKQVEMSAITVTLRTEASPTPATVSWRPVAQLKTAIADAGLSLVALGNFVIFLLVQGPVVLLWSLLIGGLLLVAWKVLRWVYRRFFATGKSATEPSPAATTTD